MRKSDLHPKLQATCVPVPGRSGCFAVIPEPVPSFVDAPSCHGLFMLARRELDALGEAIGANEQYARLVFHMLNRREAVDSSQIEGTHTSFDGLLIHEMDENPEGSKQDQDANETLGYVRAFVFGSQEVADHGQPALRLDLIRGLHAKLLAGKDGFLPGCWRDRQNFIGARLETARYIPPPASEIPRLMDDFAGLLQYASDDVAEVSILMRAAIAHVQFEAIHPFLDGNGRIGRMLLPLMLAADGKPPIHLATFLKVRQQDYYEALRQVQMCLDWTPWIKLFLESVIASCRHTVQLFGNIRAIQARWQGMLTRKGRRKHAAIWKTTDLLLGQPVVTVRVVADRLGVTFPAANDAIAELVDLGIVRPANLQRRNRVFHAHEVLNALYTGLDAVLDDVAGLSRGAGA